MSINFSHSKLFAKTYCSSVSADGFDVTNLIASDFCKRSKGFQAERFTRVPVFFAVEFPVPIHLHKIVIKPWIGQQCVKVMNVYTARNSIKKSEHHVEHLNQIQFSAGRAVLENVKRVIFINTKYRGDKQPSSAGSNDINEAAELVQLSGQFNHVTAVKIGLLQMLKGSVPSVASVDVWGEPSHNSKGEIVRELRIQWSCLLNKNAVTGDHNSVQASGSNRSESVSHPFKETNHLQQQTPEHLLDPLVFTLMETPILLPSGYTVDQKTLDKHVKSQADWGRPPSDPFTGVAFNDVRKPVVNVQLKMKLDNFVLEHRGEPSSVPSLPEKYHAASTSNSNNDAAHVISDFALKRCSTSAPADISKKIKFDTDNKQQNFPLSSNSIHSSLEDSLAAARRRSSRFRPVQSNKATDQNILYCSNCNVFLTSLIVQYSLPCGHKLCRECSLKYSACISDGPNSLTWSCQNCRTPFQYKDIKRTFV